MKKIKHPAPQKAPSPIPRPVQHIVDLETVQHPDGTYVIGADFGIVRDRVVVRAVQEPLTLEESLRLMEERNPSRKRCHRREKTCHHEHGECWVGRGSYVANKLFPPLINPDPRVFVQSSRQHSRTALLAMMATILGSAQTAARRASYVPFDGLDFADLEARTLRGVHTVVDTGRTPERWSPPMHSIRQKRR